VQLQFQRIQKGLVKEKTAENDHEERAEDHGVGMEIEKPLYEGQVDQHNKRIKDHKPGDESFVCL